MDRLIRIPSIRKVTGIYSGSSVSPSFQWIIQRLQIYNPLLHPNVFFLKMKKMQITDTKELQIALRTLGAYRPWTSISIQKCSYFGWRVVYIKPGFPRLHGYSGREAGWPPHWRKVQVSQYIRTAPFSDFLAPLSLHLLEGSGPRSKRS